MVLLLIAIFILPLIIINAVANIITYHLNSRQQEFIFFAEHLDNKLQTLEYTRKKLHYLGASLIATIPPINEINNNDTQPVTPEKQTKFARTRSRSLALQTKFFSRSNEQLPVSNPIVNVRPRSFCA
jgi:hypothetical protein